MGSAGAEQVLVVEDEAVVRDLLVRVLRDQGLGVEACADGEEALRRLRGPAGPVRYALVICDVRLPRRSGIELYQSLRDDGGPAVPFVFITGDTLSAQTGGLLRSLGVPHLNKPFEIEEFVALVRRELAR